MEYWQLINNVIKAHKTANKLILALRPAEFNLVITATIHTLWPVLHIAVTDSSPEVKSATMVTKIEQIILASQTAPITLTTASA